MASRLRDESGRVWANRRSAGAARRGRGTATHVPLRSRPPPQDAARRMTSVGRTRGSSVHHGSRHSMKDSHMRLTRTQLTTMAVTASMALTGASAAYASGGSTGGGGTTPSQTPKVDTIKVTKAYTNATPDSGG